MPPSGKYGIPKQVVPCHVPTQRTMLAHQRASNGLKMVCPDFYPPRFKPAAMHWRKRASRGLTFFKEAMKGLPTDER